jgi:pimeloyl-ACP methyl ester carboxylesterase
MSVKPIKTVFKGNENKPAVIFIHGLGMDEHIWINPFESRILAGEFPITTLLSKKPQPRDFGQKGRRPRVNLPRFSIGEHPHNLRTLFHDLRQKDYTVVTWSQRRPAAPLEHVVSELKEIVEETRAYTRAGIILVGHSRGGLVGRKYLMGGVRSIRGLVTISTPHKGSSLAKISTYLSPLAKILSPFFSDKEKGTLSFTIKKMSEFFRSKALKELLPESAYIRSLKDGPCSGVSYVSIGGTKPTLFSLYRWKWDPVREGGYRRWFLRPEELFSVPDIFEKVVPLKLYPEEMREGKGDGLVSAESSQIPWGSEHHVVHLNHAQILFDKGARETLVQAIEKMG